MSEELITFSIFTSLISSALVIYGFANLKRAPMRLIRAEMERVRLSKELERLRKLNEVAYAVLERVESHIDTRPSSPLFGLTKSGVSHAMRIYRNNL